MPPSSLAHPSAAEPASLPGAPGTPGPSGAISASVAAPWRASLLGRVQAESASGSVTRWPTRAVACLLARLALAPQRAHPREELIELLWPGVAPQNGRARLRQALSQLRSLLEPPDATWPPVLLADRHAVHVAPGALDCDTLDFERAAATGDVARAAQLYLGEFMPGHYDEWVLLERRRLEDLAAALGVGGAPAGATPVRRPHAPPVGVPPAATARPSGEPGGARPVGDAGGARPVGTLPSYWTRAFGAEESLARLRGLVVTQRLVNVLGPGGSGKTRLAGELAQALVESPGAAAQAAHAPFERVLYASLADCRDAAALVETLSGLARPAGAGDPLVRLADWLGAAPTLAILDNAEQLDEDAGACIERLLHAAPSLHVLLTSRRRLGLDGERVFELGGLALAPPGAAIAAALASPAVALFVDRARASRPEFHLTAANVEPVVALTRLLGGMPLAIELAASRLRALQPAELLRRLREGAGSPLLDLLARPAARAGARSRHASMRHVVAWSWAQLRPELARLLRALSVLKAPASAEVAAWALAALDEGAGPSPAAAALPRVQALLAEALESSLLRAWPDECGDTLYGLLPPVLEYAAEQCRADEPPRVRRAVRRALLALAPAAEGPTSRPREATALQLAALIASAPADDALPAALDLAIALRGHWNQRQPPEAVMKVLEQAVDATDDAGRSCSGHLVLATLWLLAGRPDRSRSQAERALERAPDPARRAHAQVARASAAMYLGQDIDALDGWLAVALADAEAGGSDTAVLEVLRTQGMVAVNLREDYATAEPLVRRCIRLHERHGDLPRLRQRQLDLAACLGWTGREAAAAELLQACIAAARQAGEHITAMAGLVQLGRVRLRLRQGSGAAAAFEAAVHLARRSQRQAPLLWALLHLPEAWVSVGRAEPAALLQGHIVAAWQRQMGQVNRIEARELKRARRLIVHALGAARAAALFEAGRGLAQAQALALLPPEAAGPGAASGVAA